MNKTELNILAHAINKDNKKENTQEDSKLILLEKNTVY